VASLALVLAAVVLTLFSVITGHALSASTTTLTSGTNPTVWGQSVTLTATVTPAAPAPTGTVAFKDGAANIAGCGAQALVAGVATCTTTTLAVASHTITAVYSGGNYAGSTSAPVVQVVSKGNTGSAVTSSANSSVSGQTVTYTATVTVTPPASGTPTGTVNFKDGGLTITGCGLQAVSGGGTATCAVAYPGPGSHTITAIYSGDPNFGASTSAVLTQIVNQASTSTVVTSSANPSLSGQTVTYTAKVTATPPASGARTGTVNFKDGGLAITGCGLQAVSAGGTTTCAVTYPGPGIHPITALYSGDANYTASTSAVLTQIVNQASTSTVVTSSANPSVSGQTVTYTAKVKATAPGVGTPTGTVNFKDGGLTITGCGLQAVSAGGTATCAVTYPGPGTHPITAIYSGDTNYTASTSASLTQTVNAGATKTVTTSSVTPSRPGQSVTYTATVTSVAPATGKPTGSATFKDGAATIAGCIAQPLVAGMVACAVTYPGVGTHAITAVYSGDANFGGSTSVVLTQAVQKAATSSVVTSSANPSVSGQGVTYSAIVSASPPAIGTPTGTATFKDGVSNIAGCVAQPLVAGIATCPVTYPGVGTHAITAVYSGDANFVTSTSPTLTQFVDQGATTTVVTSSVNPSVSGQTLTYTATVSESPPATGTPTGTATFMDGVANVPSCVAQPLGAGMVTCAVTYPGVGIHAITALYSGDPNFAASTSAVLTQAVNQGATTTVVTSSVNPSVSGQSLAYTATVSASPPATGTPSGTAAFMDGVANIPSCVAQPVIGGMATCAVTYPGAGTHAITAVYGGDVDFLASTSPILTQSVNQGATTTVVTSSVNPSVSGQSLTYTATVSPSPPAAGSPSGTATFMDGAVNIPGCVAQPVVAGMATCPVTYPGVGTHAITAVYSGDPNFAASTSAVLTQAVNQASTATVLTSSANPSVSGQTVTYTATVSAVAPGAGTPTGTVDFQDGGVTITGCVAQPLVAGSASCVVTNPTLGAHSITAVYSGNVDFSGSTSPTLTQWVTQGALSASVGDPLPIPDSGASAAAAAIWGSIAVLAGAVLLAWAGRARRRRRSAGH
jgi:hypothetical protein